MKTYYNDPCTNYSLLKDNTFMNYYMAPMEGLTTYIFRNAFHQYYGGIDKYFTPFLCNRHMSSREKNDILPEHNSGMCTIPQILTNRAEDFEYCPKCGTRF